MNKETKSLKIQNDSLRTNLNKENKEFLSKMQVYLNNKNITRYNFESIKQDIINILFEAQLNGRSCKEVIGEDYKLFCDELLKEIPKMSKKQQCLRIIKEFVLILIVILCFIPLENLIDNNLYAEPVIKYFHLFSICLLILFVCMVSIINRRIFVENYFVYEFIVLFIYNILYQIFNANGYLQTVICHINFFVLLLMIFSLLCVYKLLDDRI